MRESYDYVDGISNYYSYFNKLIEEYEYNPKALLLYLDTLKTFEAIEDMCHLLGELVDYARMMNTSSP